MEEEEASVIHEIEVNDKKECLLNKQVKKIKY